MLYALALDIVMTVVLTLAFMPLLQRLDAWAVVLVGAVAVGAYMLLLAACRRFQAVTVRLLEKGGCSENNAKRYAELAEILVCCALFAAAAAVPFLLEKI